MSEQDQAKKIAQHLDQGLTQIGPRTITRLQAARKAALAKYAAREPVFGLAWAGHWRNNSSHGHSNHHLWLPIIAMVLGLLTVSYWHNSQQNSDAGEVDAALLAEDLPIHAYLDKDFDIWLESSAR